MDIYQNYLDLLINTIKKLQENGHLPKGGDLSRITVDPSYRDGRGDMATNAAMVMAKSVGMAPRALADLITQALHGDATIQSIDIAGPGFINITLHPHVWTNFLRDIIASPDRLAPKPLGKGQRINVEYVSANPTGPMHAGHGRVAVVGDAIASLLEFVGYDVEKEFYINDGGVQIDTLARSVYIRYREALGETIPTIPEGLYPGDYLKPVGESLATTYGDSLINQDESVWLPPVREHAVTHMMDAIKKDLAHISIHHSRFSSEKDLVDNGHVDRAMHLLTEKGLTYTGVIDPPKGKTPDDWEPEPQFLFKSTLFGDDVDRVLRKADGSWTYFAKDIAYHYDKYQRGFLRQINIWGADHGGYVKRIKAALSAITDDQASLDVKICQIVNFTDQGHPVRMSKRAGTFITLEDVIDAVGKDVIRFTMLTRKNDAHLDFDFAKVKEQSKDNPIFYVQYAHARIHSVFRQAQSIIDSVPMVGDIRDGSFDLLTTASETAMIKMIAEWPRHVLGAAIYYEPHRICFYLYDLAGHIHGLWNQGKEESEKRFIVADNPTITLARLGLLQTAAQVLSNGLHLLGITPVKEM